MAPWPAHGTLNWDTDLRASTDSTPKLLTGNSNSARSMFAGAVMLNRSDLGNGVVVGVDQARGVAFGMDTTTHILYNGRFTAPAQGYSAIGTPTGVVPANDRICLVRAESPPGHYYTVWFGADTSSAAIYNLSWDLATMTKVKDLTAGSSPFGTTVASNTAGDAVLVGEYGDPLVTGTPTPHIWRSTDYGSTWTATYTGTGGMRHIHAIAFDPNNAGHVYATTGDGDTVAKLLWSTNSGATWSEVYSGYNYFQAVQISFSTNYIWLAGDGDGVSGIVVDYATKTPKHAARNSHFQIAVPGGAPGDMFYSQAFYGAFDATTSRYYFVTSASGSSNINNFGNRHGVFYIDAPGGDVRLVTALPSDYIPGRVYFYDDGSRHMLLAGNVEIDVTDHISAPATA